MDIKVDAETEALTKWLDATQRKHLPSVYRNALNETAFETMKQLKTDLPKYIDRPTPFTTKGIQYGRAEKTKLVAKVGFASKNFGKRPAGATTYPADYMHRLTYGGTRTPTRTATPVPTKHYKTNKFGNIKRNDISKFLGNDKKYFSGIPKGMHNPESAGIWKRMGRGGRKNIVMVIAWEKSTKYSAIYPFGQQVSTAVRKKFKGIFYKHMNDVLRRKGVPYTPKFKLY